MFDKLPIPILRKLLPATIAKDIVSVQPMTQPLIGNIFTVRNGKVGFKNYIMVPNQNECVLYDTPGCTYYAVDVRPEVDTWIQEQPRYMWKHAEEIEDCHSSLTRYIISEELLTWMTLRWG